MTRVWESVAVLEAKTELDVAVDVRKHNDSKC